jgi:hypothetical protein
MPQAEGGPIGSRKEGGSHPGTQQEQGQVSDGWKEGRRYAAGPRRRGGSGPGEACCRECGQRREIGRAVRGQSGQAGRQGGRDEDRCVTRELQEIAVATSAVPAPDERA